MMRHLRPAWPSKWTILWANLWANPWANPWVISRPGTLQALRHAAVHTVAPALALAMGAVLCGALLAVAGKFAALMLLALMLLGVVLVLPWPWLLAGMLLTVFVLVGPLQFAAGFSKAFWIPYLMAVLLGLRLLLDRSAWKPWSMAATANANIGQHRMGLLPVGLLPMGRLPMGLLQTGLLLMGLCLATAIVSSLINRVGPLQALVRGKEYLFLWSLPAAFAVGLLSLEHLRRLWVWCTAWLVLQVPVVAWQRWVVAPQRGGDSPWDAVVGLFAGQLLGGGGSGTMALVSLWAATVVVMAWRMQRAPGIWALTALSSALLACLLAEVKVAVLLMPLLAVFVLGLPLRINRSAVGLLVAAAAFSGLLVWAYQNQFTSSRSAEGQSTARYAQTMLDRGLDTSMQADTHGQLTRLGALAYWWSRQQAADIPAWAVGHGIGAVRRTGLGEGELAHGQRFDAARSSMAIMLWETGVIGLLAWMGATAAWTVAAWRMARNSALRAAVPDAPWLLQGASAVLALCLLSLPYGPDLFDAPHLPTAFMMGLGLLLSAWRICSTAGLQPGASP